MASGTWATPPTQTVGGSATAADQNTIRDDLNAAFGNVAEVRISRAANQTISTSTQTSISFDTETTDTDGFFAATSPTVTIPGNLAGRYLISVSVIGNSVASTRGFISLVADGNKWDQNITGNGSGSVGVSTRMSASSTIQVAVFQASGGNIGYTAQLELQRTAI